MLDYTTHMDAPELVEVCRHCKHADCIGICNEYKNAFRRLMGKAELRTTGTLNGKARQSIAGEKLEAFGEAHTLAEWAQISGINYYTLYKRVRLKGWPMESALRVKVGTVPRDKIILCVDGQEMSVNAWAAELGISYQTIYARLARGYTDREALFGK